MDDMTIKPISPGALTDVAGAGATAAQGAGAGGFFGSLKDAIARVNDVQLQANQAVDQLMTGETQDVHHTMIALQKADVSFQLMMQIRNKLVAAYEDIQRMQM